MRLRQQALDWLRANLVVLTKQFESDNPKVERDLRRWQLNPGLAGVRDEAALAKLPEAERAARRHFWGEVQRLLDRAEAMPTAATSPKR